MDKTALVLTIIGGLNWLLVGLFRFDLVAWMFGGSASWFARIIYTIIGLAALWCISIVSKKIVPNHTEHSA
ncbi:MAG TPA: DUF378 domain-containing protein [Ruminococcaceae bacterium]|nr:DUF378 domain-containing protein [Oscillospiraceae bacterium]HCA71702.1 DUF378 domain-containing protein [Oscillospiraceae bacterium]HCC01541.1 DUF378 domain-containing protein [Oscillospiraceae bacterium]HCM23930.1 DUF378 domain-containing protein [Oscillospiraceae bacterium]